MSSGDELAKAKHDALLDQYEMLYTDFVTNLKSARFRKASESRQSLKAVDDEITDNLRTLPIQSTSGYSMVKEINQRMQRIPTSQAQRETSNSRIFISKTQYYFVAVLMLMVTGITIRAYVTDAPGKMEGALLVMMVMTALYFLFK